MSRELTPEQREQWGQPCRNRHINTAEGHALVRFNCGRVACEKTLYLQFCDDTIQSFRDAGRNIEVRRWKDGLGRAVQCWIYFCSMECREQYMEDPDDVILTDPIADGDDEE